MRYRQWHRDSYIIRLKSIVGIAKTTFVIDFIVAIVKREKTNVEIR